MVRVGPLGVKGDAGSASAINRSDRAQSDDISFTASITAETPRCGWLEWTSRPVTATWKVAMPL